MLRKLFIDIESRTAAQFLSNSSPISPFSLQREGEFKGVEFGDDKM
jgi:hypothetical protein